MKSFPEQLIQARKAANMTQEQLSEALHVSRATVSHWEVGRHSPDLTMIPKIAEVLNCSFSLDEEVPPEGEPDETQPEEQAEHIPGLFRKKKFLIPATILAVICIVFFALVLPALNRKPDDAVPEKTGETPKEFTSFADPGMTYRIEDFQAVTPREDGKAYLAIDTRTDVTAGDHISYWMYEFEVREENGIRFYMDRGDIIWFQNTGAQPFVMTHKNLYAAEMNPELEPYGVTTLSGGMPMDQENMIGVGFRIIGHDDNGTESIFTAYIPFPQQ